MCKVSWWRELDCLVGLTLLPWHLAWDFRIGGPSRRRRLELCSLGAQVAAHLLAAMEAGHIAHRDYVG
jgi:hypothetical protein